jgi:5-methylcytosine-specific restriction endonuclease McrA
MRVSDKKRKKNALIKQADELAREICFHRDHYKCVRCGRGDIQWAHIRSRRHLSTRWDAWNCLTLCGGCHEFFWHQNPLEAVPWFEENWPERAEHLRVVARQKITVDVQDVVICLRAEVKELER